jgi:hypothetical protein
MSSNDEDCDGFVVDADDEGSAADPTSLGCPSVIPTLNAGISNAFSHNVGASISTVSTLTSLTESNSNPASSVSTDGNIRFKIRRESLSSSKGTKSSPVWGYFQHFDLTYHPEMKHFRVCLVCRVKGVDKAISVGSSASPGPLVAHLRTHTEQYLEYLEKKDKKAQVSVTTASESQIPITSFIPQMTSLKQTFKRKYAQWVVEQSMPLNVGESVGFVEMIKVANRQLTVPDAKGLTEILYTKKVQASGKLKVFLKNRFFSITCDHWTSLANENYGALTLHLIDEFQLKTFVMSCAKHENGTTAVEVEGQLIHDLNQWGLQKKHLISCVTDTAANMNSFGASVSSWIDCHFIRHHYCADHLLQLTALKCYSGDIDATVTIDEDGEEDRTVSSLKKARALVSYFHSSTIATEKLAVAQRSTNPNGAVLKLHSDVKTRWWSTHTLVERVLELKAALQYVFDQEFRCREHQNSPTQLELLKLSADDFESLDNILFVLTPFKSAQKALEGERYVNLSLLPWAINNLRTQLGICEGSVNEAAQPKLHQLIQTMISDFNDRWGEECRYTREVVRAGRNRQIGIPTYAFWATALDPRTKKKLPKLLNQDDVNRVWADITSATLQLRDLHVIGNNNNNNEPPLPEPERPQAQVREQTNRSAKFFADSDDEDLGEEEEISFAEQLAAEVIAYKSEKPQPMYSPSGSYNNPLDWWRVYHSKYPNMWRLASCILAIPATSAPSERVFSAAGNIVNKKRVRLKPETVDLLIFLRGNKEFVSWE